MFQQQDPFLIHNMNGNSIPSCVCQYNSNNIIIMHSTVAVHEILIHAQHKNTLDLLMLNTLYQTSSRIHRSDFY